MINYYHTGSIRGNFDRLVVSKLDWPGLEFAFFYVSYCRKNVIMSKIGIKFEKKKKISKFRCTGLKKLKSQQQV